MHAGYFCAFTFRQRPLYFNLENALTNLFKTHFTDLEENRVVAASADHAAAAVGRPVRNDLATEPSGRGHALRGAGSRRSGSGDQDQEDGKPGHPEDSKVAL